MRGVTGGGLQQFLGKLIFQLTRLMRGVTERNTYYYHYSAISTHTPHARRDRSIINASVILALFQLTRLMRGVTSRARRDP